MENVFISYSTKDESIASEFLERLSTHDGTPFLSGRCDEVGEEWEQTVQKALHNTGLLVLLATKNAFASARVQREVEIATRNPLFSGQDLSVGAKLPKFFGEKVIIPVFIDTQPADTPDWISKHQCIIINAGFDDRTIYDIHCLYIRWKMIIDRVRR